VNKSFLKIFLLTFTLVLALYGALFEITNPHVTGFFNSKAFRPWHINLEYAKFDRLKEVSAPIESLVVGSSTSEAFVAADVENLFGGKAYIISLGGADTPTRFSVIQEAMKRFKSLKRIIYVADFFEFNRALAKPEVAFQSEMAANIPSFAKPTLAGFFKYYLSNNSFEDSFNILKRYKKDKRLQINADGTMNQSMVLSPLKAKSDPMGLLTSSQKVKLTEEILENTQTYKRSVLNNIKELNPNVVNLYKRLAQSTKEKGLELHFIMAPYHHDFKSELFKLPRIEKHYGSWGRFMREFDQEEHIRLVDGTTHFVASEPMSAVWRDGIHFNRETAFAFLKQLVDKTR